MRRLRLKYSQAIPSKLFTGVSSSFKFREGISVVNILSKKVEENPDFNKPLKDIKWN